jgi:hypothetical protein
MSEIIAFVASVLGIPNFFGLNSPEIYTFTINNQKYSLISGVSGIFNHAHKLVKVDVDAPANPDIIFYFTAEAEYMHTHPNKKHLYYVGKDNEIYYYNPSTKKSKKTNFLEFDVGHRHSINVIKH